MSGSAPTLNSLTSEVMGWLNRQDITSLVPGWIAMTETDIAETLRARCMVARATQNIDANFISLPADFCAVESIRDTVSGKMLDLEDEWTGPLGGDNQSKCPQPPIGWSPTASSFCRTPTFPIRPIRPGSRNRSI